MVKYRLEEPHRVRTDPAGLQPRIRTGARIMNLLAIILLFFEIKGGGVFSVVAKQNTRKHHFSLATVVKTLNIIFVLPFVF